MELAKLATSRVVLTGTPAPNGYEDLYNLFKFIWPDRDIILSLIHIFQEEKDRCKFFKAVILPESATKKDILQLETSFQMGEDEKVDYNPIEKYLKCKDLEDAGFTRDEIASFMGINKKEFQCFGQLLFYLYP